MIETEVMSNRFIGDGNNKTFAFGFKFNNKNDIQVWLYDSTTKELTKRTDFTLTPNNDAMPSEGGTVTFPSEGAAVPSTQMVIIQRHMNLFQLDVYKHGMFLDLDNFEHSLDTLVLEIQQINDSVERAVKVSIVPDAQQVDPIIPPLKAGQTIMVSEDGTHFVAVDISELFAQTTSAWKAAETSQKWAESSDSPNGEDDSESKTGKTQSSKTWALDSKASQQAVLASQNAAKISETNAKASETAAKISETNADESEANAKASEQSAASSEANAAASEQAAATSEANAAASEQAAATSETNAKNSENAAKASETNAANSETMSQKWAESPVSPDGNTDEESPTGKTMSAKEWAQRARDYAGEYRNFTGATEETDGIRGMVPAPTKGQQGYALNGGGEWADIGTFITDITGKILAPTSNNASLQMLLGGMAYILKSITGESDWKNNPKINLATLFALVGNLSSGSDVTWDGQKFTNAKLGVSGLMAQNGYIQFGKNFGGLIVQWGKATTSFEVTFPISFSEIPVVSVQEVVTIGEIGEIQAMPRQSYLTADGMMISKARIAGSGTDNVVADWFALGFIK